MIVINNSRRGSPVHSLCYEISGLGDALHPGGSNTGTKLQKLQSYKATGGEGCRRGCDVCDGDSIDRRCTG